MRKGFAAAAACLSAVAAARAEPRPLSAQEIRDLVAGATVAIDAPLGVKVPLRYARDGQVTGEAGTAVGFILGAASDSGRWWVEPGQLCHKWKVWFNAHPMCFRMTTDGQTYYWRTFDDKTGTATIIAPAPPAQTAAVTRPPVPKARAASAAARLETTRPAPPAEARHTMSGPDARPPAAAARPAAAPGVPEEPFATTAASAQVRSMPSDGAAPARRSSASARAPAFMVTNVVPGDVLNVRKGPSPRFEVVGSLPPGSSGVMLTGACRGRWCPVMHPSARGWVNSTYLAREEAPAGDGRQQRAGASPRN